MTSQKLSAKLTYDDVKEIKALIWAGQSQSDVAEAFGVSQPNINRIVHGFIWQDVPWPNMSKGAINIEDYIRRLEGLGLRTKKGTLLPAFEPEPIEPKAGFIVPRVELIKEEETTPKPLTPQQKEARDKIAADEMTILGHQAEADMELDIAKSIQADAKTARKGKERTPNKNITAKRLPWKKVQSQAPRNPMVVLAAVDDDLRKCICIAFRALPIDMWNTPKAEEVVKQVGVNLGIEIKGNFFKVKE